ncbi:type I-D CRISPR-associated helicase Cas3' [Phosphitispora sp. TUW77]|uniref:type I-D CRISPR-associated helicase Cas3' n=1 Tax=Phosphitispora sp. TUW77 TaxID=3152361 RepID=UPI003AB1CC6D
MIIKEYKIEQVKCPDYERHWPDRHPYQHQAAIFANWQSHRSFLVTTKTGSGKTVAAAFPIIVNQESAVFLYPTNALVEDQEKSIANMLSEMNYPYYSYKADTKFDRIQYQQARVILLKIDAVSLEDFRRQLHKSSKGRTLKDLFSQHKPLILLTNPDTLFYIVAFFYAHSEELLGYLQKFNNIVLDEFHMYAGIELAHVLFMLEYFKFLGIFRRTILLSATPDKEVKQLLDLIIDPVEITSDTKTDFPVTDNRTSIHEIKFSYDLETGNVVEQAINIVKKILPELYNGFPTTNEVPLVVIFNSVIDAIYFEDLLIGELNIQINQIGSYRGMVGKEVRTVTEKLIVVGTRAIEVGINFDCKYLIFEASDKASFLQRIGRIGRRRLGSAFLVYGREHGQEVEVFSELPQSVERNNFEKAIGQLYEGRDSLAWFVTTEGGIITIGALVHRLALSVAGERHATNEQRAVIQQKSGEILQVYCEKIGATAFLPKINRYFKRIENLKWLQVYLNTMSFRAGSMNVKVYDIREKSIDRELGASYEADLQKVLSRGRIKSFSFDKKNGYKIVINGYGIFRKVSVLVNVKDHERCLFMTTKEVPQISFLRGNLGIPELSEYFQCQEQILVVVPASIEPYLDWRINCYQCNVGYIGFGSNVFLLRELCRKVFNF